MDVIEDVSLDTLLHYEHSSKMVHLLDIWKKAEDM
jgi:hypothetical protein